jgi:hypothetical protein
MYFGTAASMRKDESTYCNSGRVTALRWPPIALHTQHQCVSSKDHTHADAIENVRFGRERATYLNLYRTGLRIQMRKAVNERLA